jgi:hypothetical protein
MTVPVVSGMVKANASDCSFVCELEGDFDFFEDTDILLSVDGEIAGRRG